MAFVFLAMALPHLKWASGLPTLAAHSAGGSGPYGGLWKLLVCPSLTVSPQRQMFYLLDLGLSHHSWVSVHVRSYGQAWDSDTSR